jgi:hypothetical protein
MYILNSAGEKQQPSHTLPLISTDCVILFSLIFIYYVHISSLVLKVAGLWCFFCVLYWIVWVYLPGRMPSHSLETGNVFLS